MADEAEAGKGQIVLTEDTVVLSLSPENQKNLKRCIDRGKVKITIEEIPTSKLPHIKRNGGGTTVD